MAAVRLGGPLGPPPRAAIREVASAEHALGPVFPAALNWTILVLLQARIKPCIWRGRYRDSHERICPFPRFFTVLFGRAQQPHLPPPAFRGQRPRVGHLAGDAGDGPLGLVVPAAAIRLRLRLGRTLLLR